MMGKKTDLQQSVFHDPAWPEGLYLIGEKKYLWRRKIGENALKIPIHTDVLEDVIQEAKKLNDLYFKPDAAAKPLEWKKYAYPAAGLGVILLLLIIIILVSGGDEQTPPPDSQAAVELQPADAQTSLRTNEKPGGSTVAVPTSTLPVSANPAGIPRDITVNPPETAGIPQQSDASALLPLKNSEVVTGVSTNDTSVSVSENPGDNPAMGVEPVADGGSPTGISSTATTTQDTTPSFNGPIPKESHPFDSPCVPLTVVSPDLSKRSIDINALQRIKAATVYITVGKPGENPQSSGSGFIAYRQADVSIIATNHHVIAGDGESERVITVVVNSGQLNELVIKQVEIVAENKEDDIALLRVRASDLPMAIDINCEIELIETLPVTVLGFPFGEALEMKKGNPAITISNASVSSLRNDEQKMIAAVQLSGDVNPGNSGGPVVDSNGALVGITVAKVRDTAIGFAIPAAKLRVMMRGTLLAHETRLMASNTQKAEVVFYASVCDPINRIRRATLLLSPLSADETLPEMKPNRRVDKLLDPRFSIPLSISGVEIVYRREFANEADGASARRMAYQFHYQLDTGQHFYTVPAEFNVVFSPFATLYTSQPKPGEGGISRKGILKIDDFKVSLIQLERPLVDAFLDGSNRYYVFLLDDRQTIKVFDTTKEAFVNSAKLPSRNCSFAIGKSIFFAYDLGQNMLTCYSLPGLRNFTRILNFSDDRRNRSSIMPRGLSVGKNSDTPLYVFTENSVYLFETNEFTEVGRYDVSDRGLALNGKHHFRSSSSGRTVSHWTTSIGTLQGASTNSSIEIFRYMEANEQREAHFVKSRVNSVLNMVLFGNRNTNYYTSAGIFDENFNLLNYAGSSKGMAIPSESDLLYLWIDSDGISFYENQDLYPILTLPLLENAPIVDIHELTIDKRVVFNERKEKLIVIPPENDRLIIISFDLKKYRREHKSVLLKPISLPNAKRGQKFKYTVSANSKAGKITYSLVGAPDDMTISDRGQISWQTPKDYISTTCVFRLVIADETDRQCTIRLTLDVTY